jgi:hypothetical protein
MAIGRKIMHEINQDLQNKVDALSTELAILKNSREYKLGSQLRQSKLFKLVRHIRFRNQFVGVNVLGGHNPRSSAEDVRLIGVWYDEYADGFPLETLERDLRRGELQDTPGAPYSRSLLIHQPNALYIYTRDEKLRLDFAMNDQSGQVEIVAGGRKKQIDLYSPVAATVSVYPNRQSIEVVRKLPDGLSDQDTAAEFLQSGKGKRLKFSEAEQKWIDDQQKRNLPLSLNHPDWHGILASATQLYGNVLTIPDTLDAGSSKHYAEMIIESGCPSVTIQGFPNTYRYLVKALAKARPSLPIYAIYHGNFLHFREDYDWNSFTAIKSLHEEGLIAKVGFVKKGMAEVLTRTGMKASFIMNIVRETPDGPSQPLDPGLHVGIWGQPDWSWKKSPYAMVASLCLVRGATAHCYNVSRRVQDFGDLLKIPGEYIAGSMPHARVMETMARMHVNLYVSLTECAPMLPLESLSVGSPCLLGPTSHYFTDNEYLHKRLVVAYPDNAEVIAERVQCALEERNEIIQAYREYAPDYNRRAFQALSEFLGFPIEIS